MKTYLTTGFTALLLIVFGVPHGYTEPTSIVSISGVHLETRFIKNGNKQYNQLWNILEQKGLKFKMGVLPLTRTIKKFSTVSDCIYPSSLTSITQHFQVGNSKNEFIASTPVDYISMRIFTRRDNDKIASFDQLNNKKVATWLGFDKDIYLNGISSIVDEVESEEIRMKMLIANRVDAIIGFTPDAMIVAEKMGHPIPHYDENLFVFKGEGASLVCHKTEKNQKFIEQFNTALTDMKKSGELRSILGSHAQLLK